MSQKPSAKPTPPWPRRLLYAGLVTLAFLALLEGLTRVLAGPLPELPQHDWISGQFQPDSYSKWTLLPGADVGEGEKVSPEGFRDTPLTRPKPAAERRVLVLGDSSVFGAGVRREESFAQQLEAALNPGEPSPGARQVQVINGGVPGYTTYQILERFRRARDLDINGVILYNISDSQTPEGLTDDLWFRWGAPVHVLMRHVAIYRYLQRQAWLRRKPRAQAQPNPTALRVHITSYQRNLATLRQLAADAGAWLIYVIPPMLPDADGKLPLGAGPQHASALDAHLPRSEEDERRIERRLQYLQDQPSLAASIIDYRAALALDGRRNGLPVVDGPAFFQQAWREQPERQRPLFLDTVHPSPVGHSLLARAILPHAQAALQATP